MLPLAYLVVGVAWVVGSDHLLRETMHLSLAAQLVSSWKGIAFVVVSALLLVGVQDWPRVAAAGSGLAAPVSGDRIRPLLIFLITAIGLVLAGYVLYQQQSREVSRRAAASLATTAELTAQQVEAWIGDRRSELEYAGRDPLLAHAIEQLIVRPDEGSAQHVGGALEVLRLSGGFDTVQAYRWDGQPLAAAGGTVAISDRLAYWIGGAKATGRVVMSDLYVPPDAAGGQPAIDFVVTLADDDQAGKFAAVVVARTTPDRNLFPLLEGKSVGAESEMFSFARRQGDSVVVLLPPGQRDDRRREGYEYRPVDASAAAAQVASGREGVFLAPDYRGVQVLATGRAIANTPWFLVAKVEQSEVLAPLRRVARIGLLVGLAGLIFSALLVWLWWRNERLALALQLEAAERREVMLKEHFAIAGRYVHDIVMLVDLRDGRIVEANDRAIDAYGYTREELLSRSLMDLRPAGSPEQAEARVRFEALRHTPAGHYLTHHWRKDGSSFPIEASVRRCEIEGASFVQLVGRDITERVEHEQRLAALAAERDRLLARMRSQFEDMATGCIVVSPAGDVLEINPAHERLFGYTRHSIVGLNVRDFVKDPSFRDEVHVWIARLRADPTLTLTGVFGNTRVDDRPITCRWTATALRDARGQFEGMIATAEDITEQVRAERALRNSEERYRTLAELSPVGIFRSDMTGQTVFVNERAARIVGLAPADCLGHGWARSIHPDDATAMLRQWESYVANRGATPFAAEYRLVRSDGQVVWVLTQVAPELDLAGHLQGHIGTLTDITAVKAAQIELRQAHDHLEERVAERTQELEQAKNAAEHADRVKSAFLSTMSHELRTPLNSILGFTDILLQGLSGPITEAQQKQLQIVRDSSAHLRALIEDVLDISRIEAGQIGLEFDDVDLAELVTRRVEAFGPEAVRRGIELRLEAPGQLPSIRSDRKRTAQIVNNLLSNALKFTDHGRVTVTLRATTDRMEVAVEDTGIGIPADALAKLFNPFTQVVRPGGRLHEGTGLGLAISRNLARALGGDVTAASEPGRGSRFQLWLPFAPDEVDAASTSGTYRKPDFRRELRAV